MYTYSHEHTHVQKHTLTDKWTKRHADMLEGLETESIKIKVKLERNLNRYLGRW